MPEPISSNNSSVYDRSALQSPVDGCDPTTSSCAAQPPIEIEPVHIDGDACKQALLQRLESSRCDAEKGGTGLAVLGLAVAVVQVSPPAALLASLAIVKEGSALRNCELLGVERAA